MFRPIGDIAGQMARQKMAEMEVKQRKAAARINHERICILNRALLAGSNEITMHKGRWCYILEVETSIPSVRRIKDD